MTNDDILRLIFEQYALEETEGCRLDSLLLVCRQWRDTLLDYHILWGNITAIVGHADTHDACVARVATRLHRSGPSVPLDIRIIKNLDGPCNSISTFQRRQLRSGNCCHELPSATISSLLEILAGAKGAFCSRWRSLEILHDASRGYNKYMLAKDNPSSMKALTYPTPSLVSLHLSWFTVDGPILPFSPKLENLYLDNVDAPFCFHITNTRNLTYSCSHRRMYPIHFPHLGLAKQIRKLVLDFVYYTQYSSDLSGSLSFPLLEDLTLTQIDEHIAHFKVPKLKHLSLKLSGLWALSNLTDKCPGIPFDQLEYISFNTNAGWHWEHRHDFVSFLAQLTSLKRIDADSSASTLIVKLAWNSVQGEDAPWVASVHPFYGREVLLRTIQEDKRSAEILLSGKETAQELVEYASQNNLLSPKGDWDDIDEEMELRELQAALAMDSPYIQDESQMEIAQLLIDETSDTVKFARMICDEDFQPPSFSVCGISNTPRRSFQPPQEPTSSGWDRVKRFFHFNN